MNKNTVSKNPQNQRPFQERRRKQDWVVQLVTVIAVIGWVFALFALVYTDQAKPGNENFFTSYFNTDVRNYWDTSLLYMSLRALLISFVTCVLGFFVNMFRHRRKTDRYNKSIIILGTISLIAIIVLLVKFELISWS